MVTVNDSIPADSSRVALNISNMHSDTTNCPLNDNGINTKKKEIKIPIWNVNESDSTLFGRRNDTTFLYDKKFNKINEMDHNYRDYAYDLKWGHCGINVITKDNITRIMKHYQNLWDKTLTREVCDNGRSMKNSQKKICLTHFKNCLSQRAKELNVYVNDLDKDFEGAMQASFKGFWVKLLGIMKKKNIERLEDITKEYQRRIEQKEIEIREYLFHKPFSDEKVEEFLDKTEERGAYVAGWNPLHENYVRDLAQDTILSKGINFTGKIEYPSQQQGGSCVIHASVNALEQNDKGSHLVDRLFRVFKDGSAEAVCIPEAVKNNRFYYPMANTSDIETLAWKYSFGDGDMAAFVNAYDDYLHMNKIEIYGKAHSGFEVLSGEHAQVYFPDEPIPKGVGIVNAERGDKQTLYNNLKTMLNKGEGAAVFAGTGHRMGNYISDLETEKDTGKEVLAAHNHLYSIVKITDNYVYMQESNTPTLYIKITKKVFFDSLYEISTWRYD